MTDTACMLPKWYRADMKFLDIINGANSKFTFFCDCKAVDKRTKKKNQFIEREKGLSVLFSQANNYANVCEPLLSLAFLSLKHDGFPNAL